MLAIVWLVISLLGGILPLLAVAGLYLNGLLFTVDGLFMSLILLAIGGIFFANVAACVRRYAGAKPDKGAAPALKAAQAAAGTEKGN